MRSIPHRILLLFVLHAGGTAPLAGQAGSQPAVPTRAWVTVGFGAGTEGFAGLAGVDVLARQHLVSIRSATVANILDDGFWDVALLYGRAARWSRSLVAVSTGVALMDGERCSGLGACTQVAARLSVPLAGRVSWQAPPFLGLAVHGFANLNSEQSFAGATLAIEVGRVR